MIDGSIGSGRQRLDRTGQRTGARQRVFLAAGNRCAVAPLLEPLSVATHARHRARTRPGRSCGGGNRRRAIRPALAVLALAAARSQGAGHGRLPPTRHGLRLASRRAPSVSTSRRATLAWSFAACRTTAPTSSMEPAALPARSEQAVAMARRGGGVGLIGLCHGPAPEKHTGRTEGTLALIGSRGYGRRPSWRLDDERAAPRLRIGRAEAGHPPATP